MLKRIIILTFLILMMSTTIHISSWAQDMDTCKTCHTPTVEAIIETGHSEMSCSACHEGSQQHVSNPTKIKPEIDVSAENCGQCHTLVYNDYRYVNKVDQTPQKFEQWPLLPKLLSGHAFAKDYREPREHFNMLEDIELTTRGKGATCYTCKSADVYHQWNEEGGINYDSDVEELLSSGKISHPITCVNCHSPHDTQLRVVGFALKNAREQMPADHPGQKDTINTQVCSQCHVNYNFSDTDKTIEFPYREVADMLDYIQNNDIWTEHVTGSWVHPELDQRLYKVQHPETELYWNSVHHQAGVSCASCHMPKITAEDGTIFTQHYLGSPRNNPDEICGSCHNESKEWYEQQIKGVQDQVYQLMEETMDQMSIAIDMIEETSVADKFSEDLLTQAREAYFISHLNWEWIAAENSMGWHNQQEAVATLNIATEKAQEAQQLAQRSLDEPDATVQQPDAATKGLRNPFLWIAAIVIALAAFFILKTR